MYWNPILFGSVERCLYGEKRNGTAFCISIRKRSRKAFDNYKCKIRFGLTVAFARFLPTCLFVATAVCYFAPFIRRLLALWQPYHTVTYSPYHPDKSDVTALFIFFYFIFQHRVPRARVSSFMSRCAYVICYSRKTGTSCLQNGMYSGCVVNWMSLRLKLKFIIIIVAVCCFCRFKAYFKLEFFFVLQVAKQFCTFFAKIQKRV